MIISMCGFMMESDTLEAQTSFNKNAWDALLKEGFGRESTPSIAGVGEVTGEYIAETIYEAFDEKRIAILAGEEGYDNAVEFAVENGIISRSQVHSVFNEEAARKALQKAWDLYTSDQMYPEYEEIVYKENVVETYDWDVTIDDDNMSGATVITATAPKEGEILLLKDEYGIVKARKVAQVTDNGSGSYDLELVEVEDISEIAEEISFSGFVDFSSLPPMETPSVSNESATTKVETDSYLIEDRTASRGTPYVGNFFTDLVDGGKELASDIWEGGKKVVSDIGEGIADGVEAVGDFIGDAVDFMDSVGDAIFGIPFGTESDNANNIKIGVNAKITSDKEVEVGTLVKLNGVQYDFGINSNGELASKISWDNVEAELKEADDDKKKDGDSKKENKKDDSKDTEKDSEKDDNKDEQDKDKGEASAEASISGSVELRDFKVNVSGYLVANQWWDSDNYIDVTVETDILYNITFSGEFEAKSIPIAKVRCPIPVTGGTVALEMNVYLVVSAEGEISLTWEFEGIHTEVSASVADGLEFDHRVDDKKFEMEVKVEASAGLGAECAISFCDLDLIDPGFTIKPITVSASILPKNEGFEDYPACVELGIRGIDLEISMAYGDDNAVTKILNAIGADLELTFNALDSSEKPLYKKTLHIEKDKDGKLHIEDECTRVLPPEIGGSIGGGLIGGDDGSLGGAGLGGAGLGGALSELLGGAVDEELLDSMLNGELTEEQLKDIFGDFIDDSILEKIENGELTDEELEDLLLGILDEYSDDIDNAAGCLGGLLFESCMGCY